MERVPMFKTMTDKEQVELIGLVKLYWNSYYNSPEGVIGVGRITYAERQLVLAQEVAA
jgi:hypothetical protein